MYWLITYGIGVATLAILYWQYRTSNLYYIVYCVYDASNFDRIYAIYWCWPIFRTLWNSFEANCIMCRPSLIEGSTSLCTNFWTSLHPYTTSMYCREMSFLYIASILSEVLLTTARASGSWRIVEQDITFNCIPHIMENKIWSYEIPCLTVITKFKFSVFIYFMFVAMFFLFLFLIIYHHGHHHPHFV